MAELLICFREVLEAALIIGILYTYLSKIGRKDMLPILWRGVVAALVLSLISSFIFQIVACGFTGQAENISIGELWTISSS